MSNPAAPAPVVDTMTVKVDGIVVVVPKTSPDPLTGKPLPTTMIQACNLAKVEVPHYCYHPRLPVSGNCRMCLVEYGTPALGPDRQPLKNPDGSPVISKSPRPAIACATPISPGMEIYTATPGVKQMRQGVLESFLINHPLDCPICDQAGECKLQEYSMEYGQATSRFAEAKVHKPKRVDLGPRIMLDAERCILCTRCIRFTRDIAGDDALGIVNRGSFNTISTYPGQPFDNNYTLNTVDLCPVGALTSKDFRFQMRVWFLREAKSLCTSCGTGCNVVIGSREGRVYRYVPRDNEAVNGSWMCDAGRLNYKWIARPDRLSEVRKRGADGKISTLQWGAAMSELRTLLETSPKGSVAIIGSARQTNEELFLLKRLATKLGAVTDSIPRQGEPDRLLVSADKNPNTQGARLIGIASDPIGSALPKIADGIRQGQVKTLVVFGEDVTRYGIGKDLLAKLGLLVACDILPNSTTEAAHFILPGCAHAEKRGTFTNTKGRVQRFWKAVEPPGAARPEAEILSDLLGDAGHGNPEGLFKTMSAEITAFQGLTLAGVGDRGVTLPV
jgi:NADH-quinone oxidoreductase subunit G